MVSMAAASSAGEAAGWLASWDLICSGNLCKNRPRSNLDMFFVVELGHRDKMLSMSTNGFSEPRLGRSRRLLTFCMLDLLYALHRCCLSSV